MNDYKEVRKNIEPNEVLVQRYQASGCTDNESLNQLIIQNEPLVLKLTKRYRGRSYYEDILQAARMGIMNAAKKFDLENGVKFSTYMYRGILFEMGKCQRSEYKQRFIETNSDLIDIVDKEDTSYRLSAEQKEINIILLRAIKWLTPKRQEVIRRILLGDIHEDIALDCGITRQAVSLQFVRSKNCLYNAMAHHMT